MVAIHLSHQSFGAIVLALHKAVGKDGDPGKMLGHPISANFPFLTLPRATCDEHDHLFKSYILLYARYQLGPHSCSRPALATSHHRKWELMAPAFL